MEEGMLKMQQWFAPNKAQTGMCSDFLFSRVVDIYKNKLMWCDLNLNQTLVFHYIKERITFFS